MFELFSLWKSHTIVSFKCKRDPPCPMLLKWPVHPSLRGSSTQRLGSLVKNHSKTIRKNPYIIPSVLGSPRGPILPSLDKKNAQKRIQTQDLWVPSPALPHWAMESSLYVCFTLRLHLDIVWAPSQLFVYKTQKIRHQMLSWYLGNFIQSPALTLESFLREGWCTCLYSVV